ncbi:dihydroneopterin aldolase [Amphibacillus sediminis]|uniref:dihydroneopterin aldolase n=1 Tax=Amphibacillus sediminis TaxID=360185 RepID=UPI00082EFE1B|nr:dihydroneopterin aldolase [Amphibacillus sediminis]
MDKIILNELAFYGYHGALKAENELGQSFIVDLVLSIDLKKAGQTDDLNYTIHYGEVYTLVKEIVEGEHKALIESVAEQIAQTLFEHYKSLQACTVRVTKPNPPIPGHYNSVAIEIFRERSE